MMAGRITTGISTGRFSDSYFLSPEFESSSKKDKSVFKYLGFHITYQRYRLNEFSYPSKGTYFLASIKTTNTGENFHPGSAPEEFQDAPVVKDKRFWDLYVTYENYKWRFGKWSIPYSAELSLSWHPKLSNPMIELLTTNAYRPIEYTKTMLFEDYRADKYAALSLGMMYSFSDNFTWRLSGYVFQPYKKRNLVVDSGIYRMEDCDYFSGRRVFFNTALVYHSMIGPLAFNVRYEPEGKSNFYYMFNIGFIIFNKSWWDRN
jgi:NTE family protein